MPATPRVFLSATKVDLIQHRIAAKNAIIDADCPIGVAANEAAPPVEVVAVHSVDPSFPGECERESEHTLGRPTANAASTKLRCWMDEAKVWLEQRDGAVFALSISDRMGVPGDLPACQLRVRRGGEDHQWLGADGPSNVWTISPEGRAPVSRRCPARRWFRGLVFAEPREAPYSPLASSAVTGAGKRPLAIHGQLSDT